MQSSIQFLRLSMWIPSRDQKSSLEKSFVWISQLFQFSSISSRCHWAKSVNNQHIFRSETVYLVLSGGRQLLTFTNSESPSLNTEFAENIPTASEQENEGESHLGPTVKRQRTLFFVCVSAYSFSASSPTRMSFLRARTLTVSSFSLILLSREELAKYYRIN